jgi:hypothetical protein
MVTLGMDRDQTLQSFWQFIEAQYKGFAALARDVLCVQSAFVLMKRGWSLARLFCDFHRTQLDPTTLRDFLLIRTHRQNDKDIYEFEGLYDDETEEEAAEANQRRMNQVRQAFEIPYIDGFAQFSQLRSLSSQNLSESQPSQSQQEDEDEAPPESLAWTVSATDQELLHDFIEVSPVEDSQSLSQVPSLLRRALLRTPTRRRGRGGRGRRGRANIASSPLSRGALTPTASGNQVSESQVTTRSGRVSSRAIR